MQDTNGAAAPNEPTLDAAIDAVIDDDQQPVIEETHKLASKLAEMEQQLRAKDEVIARQNHNFQTLSETSRKQSETLSQLMSKISDAEGRGYQMERERYEAIQRKAAAEADVVTFDEAARAIRALDYQRAQEAAKGAGKPATQQTATADVAAQNVDPVAAAWLADNQWMRSPRMFREASLIDANLQEDKPYLTTSERLAEVKAEMVKRHPEKFGGNARPQAPAVSRPGPQSAAARPKPKTKTVADLPDDAKQALARIKRRDPSFSDDDYLKSYKWDN